jgi:hypothetical protein
MGEKPRPVTDSDGRPRYTHNELFEAGFETLGFKRTTVNGYVVPGFSPNAFSIQPSRSPDTRFRIEKMGYDSLERKRKEKPIAFAVGRLIRKFT